MMLVCRCRASSMAAAVLPTAVGPTMIMTVGVCKMVGNGGSKSISLYQLFFGAGILASFFFPFPFSFLMLFGFGFGRFGRSRRPQHSIAFASLGEVVFFFDLGEFVADQPLCTVLGRRD